MSLFVSFRAKWLSLLQQHNDTIRWPHERLHWDIVN